MNIRPTVSDSAGGPPGWLLAATAALAIFVGLGSFALIDPNEPVYAQTGIEMLQRGDWLVPWFHGQPWFDKPVLFFALEGAFQELRRVVRSALRLSA